jgi:branched-subunit amino acid aminotransferase/4-amino-4-deoxychorismate lyase
MSMPKYVSINGDITRAEDARVNILTPALLDSFGVYESIRVEQSVPFHLEAHLQRLANSAALLDLTLPAPPEVIQSWVQPLLAQNGVTMCQLRIVALGSSAGNGPLCTLWPQETPCRSPALYQEGVSVITVEGMRYLPQVKSLNTLLNFLARREARRQGVHEALLRSGDVVSEGASSNFFVGKGGRLLTAPGEIVLPGVTRALVLQLAQESSVPTEERRLHLSERATWDEAFITSTSRKVLPVTCIDGQPVGDGQPGLVTRHLMDLFATYDRQYLISHQQSAPGAAEKMPRGDG